MDNGYQILEIIILAMIAAFIGLRLRSVLGRRPDDTSGSPYPPKPMGKEVHKPDNVKETKWNISRPGAGELDHKALKGLPQDKAALIRQIFGPISPTGLLKFIDGAKQAYGLTLQGFWNGDMSEMEPFIEKDVLDQFKAVIKDRKKRGEKVENQLVEILDVHVDDAEIQGAVAEITLRFKSEIVAVLKDKTGKLIEGNLSDTIEVTDIWTFARNLKAKDPNWTLIATAAV